MNYVLRTRTATRVAAAASAALLACGLASCSNGEQDSTASSKGASSGSAASSNAGGASESDSTAAFPATISTKFGDVAIDEAPQRVVALGWGDAEVALSLGVQPVGAADWLAFGGEGVGPWVTEGYGEAPEILGTMELNYESIAALEPDLILDVRSSGDQERYDTLSAIAPVVGIPEGADNWLTDRSTQLEMIGTALGKSAEAAEQEKELDERIAEISAAHPEWAGKTASVLAKTADEWGAYKSGDTRADLLVQLGFKENEFVKTEGEKNDTFYVSLSGETVSQADSDVVVGFAIGGTPEELEKDSAWQALRAVQEGHAFVLDNDLSQAFSLGTVQATNYALDKLVPLLETATT